MENNLKLFVNCHQILSGDEKVDGEELGDGGEEDPSNSGAHVDDTLNCPDEEGRVLVNVGRPDGEDPVYVPPQLARVLKPHQGRQYSVFSIFTHYFTLKNFNLKERRAMSESLKNQIRLAAFGSSTITS